MENLCKKNWSELTGKEKNTLRKWNYSEYSRIVREYETDNYLYQVEKDLANIEIKSVKMQGRTTASGTTWYATINEGLSDEYKIDEIYVHATKKSYELERKLFELSWNINIANLEKIN